jgi:arylsulfatase A-like enzyme
MLSLAEGSRDWRDPLMHRRHVLGMATLAASVAGVLSARTLFAGEEKRKPNILLIVADDMGYSDLECYGGDVRAPNLSRLAEEGVRFTQHYSTGRCWPSRACILTGYYAQQIRRDKMPGVSMGNRPAWAPLLPQLLKPAGYRAYHSGKWHIDGTPEEGGFDRSWGWHQHGCDWDRYFATTAWTEGPYSGPADNTKPYYSTVAIADHAIACLKLHREQTPDRPFFQYVAFYAPHFPLQAPKEDVDRYRDAYRVGWDEIRQQRWKRMTDMGLIDGGLSARQPDTIPGWNLKEDQLRSIYGEGEAGRAVAWDTLTAEQKNHQATKMAIHAAMISRMDHEIGRLIRQLKDMGAYDNTLILFVSDNGASAEQINRGDKHKKGAVPGSAQSYLCLGPGWSTAANTPFRYHKHWNHEGGIASPLIAHWPDGIRARGELRHDPSHFIDMAPTVLELAGVEADAGDRSGISLVPAFAGDGAVRHPCLWWCHEGNKALRMGDWKIAQAAGGPWELYDLKKDRSEMQDVSASHPEVLAKLRGEWEALARSFRKRLAPGSE